MPSFDRLYAEYKSSGLDVLLVNLGEPEGLVRDTVAARGYRMPVVLDVDGDVSRRYLVRGTPTVFFIDRKGLVVGRAIGTRDWAGPVGRAVVQALLAQSQEGE